MARVRVRLKRVGPKSPSARSPLKFYFFTALGEESAEQRKLFEKIDDGWTEHKLSISKKGPKQEGGRAVVHTGALASTESNQILSWINYGTGPRDIVPRPDNPSGLLKFMRGYTPSTNPGSLSSGTKQRHLPWVARRIVREHVIDARAFDEVIQEMRRSKFPDIFRDWMAKYASQFWIQGK